MRQIALPSAERIIAFVVRHGKTALNEGAGKLRAWENVPLDADGQIDALQAAQFLKPYNPKQVYSSDLLRDTQTGMIIAKELGNIPFDMDFALRTADMGTLTGMDEAEAYPYVKMWYQRPWEPAPGEAESYNGFLQRFLPFFDAKLELARGVEEFRPTVFVAHGRNCAALDERYNFKQPENTLMPMPGGILAVYHEDATDKIAHLTPTEPTLADQ